MGANDVQSQPARLKFICTQCGYKGREKNYTKGSFILELVLWLFGIAFCWLFLISLIIPIIYSLWRMFSRFKACPECKGNMIKIESPVGRKLLQELG